ncbi:MAG: phage portal protein, partial [Thermoleophilia bacterium]|nr:phage portal protein [Thermoleophilia bacterium]
MSHTEQAAHAAEDRLQAILKAVVVGAEDSVPASVPGGEETLTQFTEAGAIEPPYDPLALCLLTEHSNSLRQNVDAYAVNIDGFGHRLEPAIDFEDEGANEQVAECIYLERVAARDRGDLPEDAELEPSTEDVATRRAELQRLARVERARLTSFFSFCCFDHSFVDLRRRSRQDLEVTGNAYWEVLRNGKGEVARLVYVPSYTVRLLSLDVEPVEVTDRIQVSPVSFEPVTTRVRLRRFVQIQGTERVFFKSFGDPRVVSRKTGTVFADAEALSEADPEDGPATELIHFAVHSPRTPYGVPRWVGTLLAVLGSRQMEEVNYLYFENKSVPPLALLVSGGKLSEPSIPRIERFIEENLKGKDNFHRVLILEAEGGSGSGENARAKIELRPLTDAQQQDALFQLYDERNIDKVGSA